MNGREWLARQLDREGLKYRRQDNCDDFARAQSLLDLATKNRLGQCAERLWRAYPSARKFPKRRSTATTLG